jgi:phosphatidylserine/phosphatidylglycerophosphate/cardiolipin synthase-like enzyme
MEAWQSTAVGPDELAAMLLAASAVANDLDSRQTTELVWTGPTTPYVSARRTEQALLQVIDTAHRELFICSFVAYQVTTIVQALNDAIGHGVRVSILLESSIDHGGSTSTDSIGSMRALVPEATLLVWANQTEPYIGGRVHAKVAVADRRACFITSANLTTYAMERNMEAGILLTGGDIPGMLHDHLYGLVSTKVLVGV